MRDALVDGRQGALGAAPSQSHGEKTSLKRAVWGACAGALIEYYDFSIYATLAIYLSLNFFPPEDPSIAVLLAVSSMGIAFVVRPVGGILFGTLGDKLGRRKIFIVTLLMMSFATIGVGLLPGYATFGIVAPIILVGLRICQGLAVGGEYAAASTYVVEHSPANRRGYYTGWLASMASGAIVLALFVVVLTQAAMDEQTFREWGWRIPFLLAVILLAVSLIIRSKLSESPIFRKLETKGGKAPAPLMDILRDWRASREILVVAIGVCSPQITSGVTGSMLALYFLQTLSSIEPATSNLLIATGCIAAVPMTVFAGWLSDHIGRRPVQIIGMVIGILLYFPLFHALLAWIEETTIALLIIVALQIPSSLIVGAAFSAIPEIFPAGRRTTSVALVFSLAGIVGGLAPAVSLWLVERGGLSLGVAWPVVILAIGLIFNLLWVPNRTGASVE